MDPYVYVSTGKARDVSRNAPNGARVAVHFPDLGRTVELETNGAGIWHVTERPAPGHAGDVTTVASGSLKTDERRQLEAGGGR